VACASDTGEVTVGGYSPWDPAVAGMPVSGTATLSHMFKYTGTRAVNRVKAWLSKNLPRDDEGHFVGTMGKHQVPEHGL